LIGENGLPSVGNYFFQKLGGNDAEPAFQNVRRDGGIRQSIRPRPIHKRQPDKRNAEFSFDPFHQRFEKPGNGGGG